MSPPPPARVYREGLPFPPVVTITSRPPPLPFSGPSSGPSSPGPGEAPRSHYPSLPDPSSFDPTGAIGAGSGVGTGLGANAIPLQPQPQSIRNRFPPNYPDYSTWKEWHINPTQHGPPGSVGPPVFVPSSKQYDELGRSKIHGYQAEVEGGEDEEEGNAKEDGESMARWYTSLAASRPGSGPGSGSGSASVSGQMTPIGADKKAMGENAEAGPSRPRSSSGSKYSTSTGERAVIDLTGLSSDSDEDDQKPEALQTTTTTNTIPKPIRVRTSEWFIRRALVKATSTGFLPPPPKPVPPSSISNLLNIPSAVQNRANAPTYVLGPEHIGHQILRERLGWHGGGLGRPEGWESPGDAAARAGSGAAEAKGEIGGDGQGRHEPEEREAEGSKVDAIVISESEADEQDAEEDELELELELDVPAAYGPGRTAPIATALKLDRLGLGHRLTVDKPRTKSKGRQKEKEKRVKEGEGRKKVTHTHEEILEAQRRARYARSGAVRGGPGVELGHKGKVRWKDRDRKDRDERRRMIAALND